MCIRDRYQRRVHGWCIDLGMPARFQFGNAPLMIGVMVGNHDAFQHQPVDLQPGLHGRGITGIDDEGTLAPGQQPDVIVFKCGNERDIEHTGTIERRAPDVNSRPGRVAGLGARPLCAGQRRQKGKRGTEEKKKQDKKGGNIKQSLIHI
eukprot:TRINITY_DN7908_c0_g1_i3.p2 TRINITY_DN7908_c0_g1~~TRINITY_DN7908_c0_g1_i3.p2  ORF type:complete len:149 (+),score=24.69 TRINITY_DN7908_c0_g1_i3:171-617(+)